MASPSRHLHLPHSSLQTASAVLLASSSPPQNGKDPELSMDSSSACSCSASETSSSNADHRLHHRSRHSETEARNGGRGAPGNGRRTGGLTERNGREMDRRKQQIQCKVKKEIDAAADADDEFKDVFKGMRRFHGNLCFKCAAGFTADCAAVCCCPLALLHLAAMAFIRLPSAMVWKMLLNLKNKSCLKKKTTKKKKTMKKKKTKQKQKKERTGEIETEEEGEEEEEEEEEGNDSDGDDKDETVKPPWRRGSPAQETYMSRPTSPFLHLHHHHHHHHGIQIVSFDSENLFQHFQTEQMDFGGFVQKNE